MTTYLLILLVILLIIVSHIITYVKTNNKIENLKKDIYNELNSKNQTLIKIEKEISNSIEMSQKTIQENKVLRNEIKKANDSISILNNGFSLPSSASYAY